MNAFDVVVALLVAGLVVWGAIRGLMRVLIGIATLIAAFLLAAHFHESVAAKLSGGKWSFEGRVVVSYILILLGVMLAGAILGYVVRKLVKAVMLSWADRLGGATLGLVAAALLAALLVLPLVAYLPFGGRILERSVLAPYITVVADVANAAAPSDLSRRYRQRIDDLRSRWRGRPAPAEKPG